MGIILKPFAWLLLFFYELFNNYGIALILFGIVVKLILFPVTLKSKKSMIQTTMLSGKMQQLQKQYGKDRERYNLEVQKLYEKEKVNPMGGCMWSMIPMVVLIALYGIIREPLTYFMSLTADQIAQIAAALDWQTVAVANGWVAEKTMAGLVEKMASGEITSVFQNGAYNQMYLASLINQDNLASLQALVGDSKLFVMNFSFLGLDLSSIPNWRFWAGGVTWNSVGLFLMVLVSTVVSYLSMKVSMATNQLNQQGQNAQVDKTNKMMMYTMPLMSLWIGFTLPAGLCVYWIAQYVVTMIQEVICAKMLKKDYEAARIAAEKREQEEKEEEKRRKEEARLERARRLEEDKQNKGKKKKNAPKKDGEPDQEGVNKDDSREGIRAYARGRAYIPGRFGGVTPYTDPSELMQAEAEAAAQKKNKKKSKSAPAEEKKTEEQTAPAVQTPAEAAPVEAAPAETAEAAPAQEPVQTETAAVETEEVEVEVEQIEVEVDENKEGV